MEQIDLSMGFGNVLRQHNMYVRTDRINKPKEYTNLQSIFTEIWWLSEKIINIGHINPPSQTNTDPYLEY